MPEERPAARHPAGVLEDNPRQSGRGGEGTARKAHRYTATKTGEGQEQEPGSREAHSRIGAHFRKQSRFFL